MPRPARVYYSLATLRVRRILIADSDSAEDRAVLDRRPALTGEGLEELTVAEDGVESIQARLDAITGRVGEFNDRYVCLGEDGVVHQVFIGDRACGDGDRAHRCELTATASIGWRLKNDSWQRSPEEINHDIGKCEASIERYKARPDTRPDGTAYSTPAEELVAEKNALLDALKNELAHRLQD